MSAPFGGITGAVAVFAGLVPVQKVGAGPFNAPTITANLLFSLAIDPFGLPNMPIYAVNLRRALGAVLMTGGVTLIALF